MGSTQLLFRRLGTPFPGVLGVSAVDLTNLGGGRRPCGRAEPLDAMVGRRADLQCSLGAVNRLALYLWHWKLPMRSSLFIYTAGHYEEKYEYVENRYLLSASKAFLSGDLLYV